MTRDCHARFMSGGSAAACGVQGGRGEDVAKGARNVREVSASCPRRTPINRAVAEAVTTRDAIPQHGKPGEESRDTATAVSGSSGTHAHGLH